MRSPRVVRPLPRSLSPSALRCYETCPRRFGLRYLTDATAVAPEPQVATGAAVHVALAALMRLPQHHRTWGAALNLLERAWTDARIRELDEPETATRRWDAAAQMLAVFCGDAQSLGTPLAIETRVRAALPAGGYVAGRVDRIDDNGTGLTVIDYKTGARPTGFDVAGDVAAQVYFVAATQTFRRPIIAIRYVWLASDQRDEWRPPQDVLDSVQEALTCRLRQICRDNHLRPVAGRHCETCELRRACALFGRARGELPTAGSPVIARERR